MSRFRYDNSHNRNRTRIDARPQGDEAVQAGMRNIHRDTRGNVIGAVTAEGQAIGTKASRFRSQAPAGGSITPRLDAGPQTPRLDRMAASQSTGPRVSFADQEKAAREKSAASGAFGAKAQNLAGRRSLFRDMQTAGGGGITPDMEKRADSLGVKPTRFRSVAASMNQAPASIAVIKPPMTGPPASIAKAVPTPPLIDGRMAKR
ncbi:MAG: hypothetical protein LLG20_22690 [Acidobacteriales bacterium]|nr:hypothetical protein [Terriglobales bacterium]